MASLTVYANEPVTRGKVVLHTSLGPLDVELWSKEAPLACRNFVQLGLEGYYDGCIFHRVIKDFMAQTGDPTGTGRGGESVYGEDFKDEPHGRLRFTHRGLLGMASSGPNTNRSQFFITLDRCEWLDGKHTIFGKVTGNSIYNLNRFADIEVEKDDRPIYPPRVLRMEVLLEPFDDIVPRPRPAAPPPSASEEEARRKRKKEKKNLSLLSFGEEAEQEERALKKAHKRKGLSSHDLLEDPKLSKQPAVDPVALKAKLTKEQGGAEAAIERMRGTGGSGRDVEDAEQPGNTEAAAAREAGDFGDRMRQQMRERRAQLQRAAGGSSGAGELEGKGQPTGAEVTAERARDEYERLRRELGSDRAADKGNGQEAAGALKPAKKWRGKGASDSDDDDDSDSGGGGGSVAGMSELEKRRAKFLEKKRASMMLSKKQRQSATLHKLSGFKQALEEQTAPVKPHALQFVPEKREAESASHYEAFDPLKHGADAERANAKIREREKVMLSMTGQWTEGDE